MPKIAYFATDADGYVHTRNSDRVYTHTVVFKGGYERAMKMAKDPFHAKTDKKNFGYYSSLADGSHEHAHPRAFNDYHPSYTAEQIAGFKESEKREIEKRIADARAAIEGHTVESYCNKLHVERIARVEAHKAAGDFDRWLNAGWCGRPDLAQTLARKMQADGYVAEILPASTK